MAGFGNLHLSCRPQEDFANLPHTEEIGERIHFFQSRSLLVWIGRNRPHTEPEDVHDAFLRRFGIDRLHLQVSKHHPEDFLVTISDPEAFEAICGLESFSFGGRQFRLRVWSARHRAERAGIRYHVKLGLDGLPMHLWNDRFAAWVVSRFCSFHFAEEHSRRREDTRVFELWAWASRPRDIPRRVWVSVVDPEVEGPPSDINAPLPLVYVHREPPLEPKRASVYEVLVHITRVVDLRLPGENGRPMMQDFDWRFGSADCYDDEAGAGLAIRPSAPLAAPAQFAPARSSCSAEVWSQPRNLSDDDDEQDGGQDDRAPPTRRRSLLQRLRWPGDRGRARDRSPRGHQGDGSYGRRRHAGRPEERSLSPATRRSRDRSLERLVHRLLRWANDDKKKAERKRRGGTCSIRPAPRSSSPETGAGSLRSGGDPGALDILQALSAGETAGAACGMTADPMALEAGLRTCVPMPVQAAHADGGADGHHLGEPPAAAVVPGRDDAETFISSISCGINLPLIKSPAAKTTPKNKAPPTKEDKLALRRSDRIAKKMKKAGSKTVEQLAQDNLAKRLGVITPTKTLTEQTREKFYNLFAAPLSEEAMAAIEDLLQAMNLQDKLEPSKPSKKSQKVVAADAP